MMQDYVEERNSDSARWHYLCFQRRRIAKTILQSFPMATPLVRVYGAIIFYLENADKVEAYLRDHERLWAEVKTSETELPDAVAVQLREAKEHPAPRSA